MNGTNIPMSMNNYIENLEKKVRRLERELEEAKEEISVFKSEDLSVLYKDTINDVYNNFKRNSDIYRVDLSENEGGMKFSLVQWSPKGTKIEDFKMLILDIRLLQTKEDIRIRVSVRVKVPDVNFTLLKNHKDTSKFEVTIPRKDFIKLSSGRDEEVVNNLVKKLVINDPIVIKYCPSKNIISYFLNTIFIAFPDFEISHNSFLSEDSDYFKALLLRYDTVGGKMYTQANVRGHGIIVNKDRRIELDLISD